MLKMLCETAMHRWMYTNWNRIAGGTFGTVYKCTAQLSDTGTVAVKQIPKQVAIQDRCVFFDVFSEIACLDAMRFEADICTLFDYGVDESGYWIVMKYYSTTLKKWRDSLPGSMRSNLPVLITVYKQILRAVRVLHRHDIVHYDLKCDNVMIELDRSGGAVLCDRAPSDAAGASEEAVVQAPRIALGDFGESRMFGAAEELDLRNRGTEIVKCPEMLELEEVGKKEGFNYDRRKRIGTNQSADIWSLGCLLFELLAGRFLFLNDDYGMFWARVTGRMDGHPDSDVVSEANARLLESCPSLVDYIRHVLVRDPQRRPNIVALVQRFEVAAAETLRGSQDVESDDDEVREGPKTPSSGSVLHRDSVGASDSPRSVARSIGGSSDGRIGAIEDAAPERPLVCAAAGAAESYFTKVLSNLCILEASDEQDLLSGLGSTANITGSVTSGATWGALCERLAQCAWTHIVDFRAPGSAPLPCQLDVPHLLALPWSSSARSAEEFVGLLPSIFDFLRHAAIYRGVVLFLDGRSKAPDRCVNRAAVGGSSAVGSSSAASGAGRGGGGLAVAAVLALVAETYRMAIYSALSFLSSQLLVAALRPDAATALARWQASTRRAAWVQSEGAVRIACICGCCSWHVPVRWLQDQKGDARDSGCGARVTTCMCSPGSPSASGCPNNGACEPCIRWLHARFGVEIADVRWLWLPEGQRTDDCSDGPDRGTLTSGLAAQAELIAVPPPAEQLAVGARRFRCRSCQVLTHAEIDETRADGTVNVRTALVCSYELLRSAKLRSGQVAVGSDGASPEDPQLRESNTSSDARGSSKSFAAASAGDVRRPPQWLHSASLEEVVLPQARIGIEDIL